ncbi:hypothetical protein LR48_Vigan02g181300 [Vigna angularis]|uniref:Uncharacterized protein n=1 Tax=Phaseolus angularis TaxID=3914 RepID=A0A0L9TYJ2_PHAAN|nr:hypothetical protein LR48_Vigan02g181300 [Vigna angularis]
MRDEREAPLKFHHDASSSPLASPAVAAGVRVMGTRAVRDGLKKRRGIEIVDGVGFQGWYTMDDNSRVYDDLGSELMVVETGVEGGGRRY